MTTLTLSSDDVRYPPRLRERFGDDSPAQLSALGNLGLLALPKTALFCSTRCPGAVILRTYDQAARWRETGRRKPRNHNFKDPLPIAMVRGLWLSNRREGNG